MITSICPLILQNTIKNRNAQLIFLRLLSRILLTLNRKDFKKLHNQNPNHLGIVICTEDIDFTGQAERIDKALKDSGEIKEQLIRVYRPSK
jgi:hypothetical protein